MSDLILFVGLGNPGKSYAQNRHNVGFMAIDRIASKYDFPAYKEKSNYSISKGIIDDQKVFLVKPSTYMNLSGEAVKAVTKFYRIEANNTTVFHDELDIKQGICKIKVGGGHAGHNGLRSINQHIGPNYRKLRIGIGHPGQKDLVSKYVLSDFKETDQIWLNGVLNDIADNFPKLVTNDHSGFLNLRSNTKKEKLNFHTTSYIEGEKENTKKTKALKNLPSIDTAIRNLYQKFKK